MALIGDISIIYTRINNRTFCETLRDIMLENGNVFEAHKLTLQYMDNVPRSELEVEIHEIDFSYIENADDKVFEEIVSHVRDLLSSEQYSASRVIAKGCFNPIVDRLYKRKDFKTVTELATLLGEYSLRDTDALFETAYSYKELGDKDQAKKHYEIHVQKYGLTSAVANNLSVIHEEEGNLQKAEGYLKEALELDGKNTRAKTNLQRVVELRNSAERFRQEKFVVKKNLLLLSYRKDVEGHVVFRERELPAILSVEAYEARRQIKYLSENKYLIKVQQKSGTYTPAYKINPDIEVHLSALEKEIEQEKEIASIVDKVTIEQLHRIGYNDILASGLKKVVSHDLQALLQRDLREAALAVLTKSYKTTLVMCGSIIEALLLEKISSRNISRYIMEDSKSKAISRMDLNDLLYVAFREKIIDDQLFYLAHALRGFRNLIHPSVEQRKAAIKATEPNARIAWDIMCKLITEL